jgi:hypothetical protein
MDASLFEKDFIPSKTSSSHVPVDQKKALLLKYREYLETEKDFYEDRCAYIEGVQKEYEEDLKTKGKVDALNIISKKLGITKKFSSNNIDAFLSNVIKHTKPRSQDLCKDLLDLDDILKKDNKSIEKIKIVFSDLWDYHTKNLEYRLNTYLDRKRESEFEEISTPWIPPTCQSYIDKETTEINKEFSRTAKDTYQQRLCFLKKLYKLVKVQLTDEQRATIQLNKNIYDVLEGKVEDLGQPDHALETLPHTEDIKKAKIYWSKSKNKNKSLLVYYHRTSHLEEKEMVFVQNDQRKKKIDWDRVTLQNIDDISEQVDLFFPNLTNKIKTDINKYKEKKREILIKKKSKCIEWKIIEVEAPKIHSIVSVESKVHSIISAKSKDNDLFEQKTISTLKENISDSQTTEASSSYVKAPKKEKNSEARKQKYELELAKELKRQEQQKLFKKKGSSEEKENNNNSNDDSSSSPQSPRSLDPKTVEALSKIFNKAKAMRWDDFVNAWKELREVIDGVKKAEPRNMGGSILKFHGGLLQDVGKKKKAKSFNLHFPHSGTNGYTLGPKTIGRIEEHFQIKFGWTLEKLKEHGFEFEEEK